MLTLRLGINSSKNNKLIAPLVNNAHRTLHNSTRQQGFSATRPSLPKKDLPPCANTYSTTTTITKRVFLLSSPHARYSLIQSATPSTIRQLSVWAIPKLLLSGQKITLWTIPKYLLTGKLNKSKNKKHRNWLLGAFGVATFLSSIFGPVVWIAVGGTASIICWRLFRKAQRWWTYLTPMTMTATGLLKDGSDKLTSVAATAASNASGNATMTDKLLSQIGTHYAAELVRKDVIQKLQNYFVKSEEGQTLLQQIANNNSLVDANQLDWEDVSRSEVVRLTNNHQIHRVTIYFWVKQGVDQGCEVKASAIVSDEGKLDIEEVKLSSREWSKDEIIPIS